MRVGVLVTPLPCVGVLVGEAFDVGVRVGVRVGEPVLVGVLVGEAFDVGVRVGVRVGEPVLVGVRVGLAIVPPSLTVIGTSTSADVLSILKNFPPDSMLNVGDPLNASVIISTLDVARVVPALVRDSPVTFTMPVEFTVLSVELSLPRPILTVPKLA
ncbi:MAG: hypothetical protein RI947_1149 [Candidatus Parcubacteria bacterium]